MDMKAEQRVWTINGDFAALRPAGVSRYAKEVTLALDALIAEGHPLTEGLDTTLVVPREPADLPLRALSLKTVPEYRSPRMPQFWVQAQLPRHVQGGLVSFCNLAPVSVRHHIACIHDLHTFLMPESYGRGFRLAHKLVLPLLGKRANFITTISELSRDHLIRHGVAPAEKIIIAYNGADHARRWDASKSDFTAGERPYVLCLGQPQKYKNVELILKIAGQLDTLGLDIYMAGNIHEETLPLNGSGMPQNLRLLGRIGDDDLAKALRGALCFLFPSRIEGFGMPAVEAMIHECPVIVSTAPCMPEICAEAALYAGPDDPDAWVKAVTQLRDHADLRERLIENGRSRAAQFSWRNIAESYLQLMRRVDDGDLPAHNH